MYGESSYGVTAYGEQPASSSGGALPPPVSGALNELMRLFVQTVLLSLVPFPWSL